MPINKTIAIRSAVGAGARASNSKPDVTAVQSQINGHSGPSRTNLIVDGLVGAKTIKAIRDFQSSVCGMRNPDGRVDPRGKTEAALNDPSSTAKFARMSVSPPAAIPGSGSSGQGGGGGKALPASATPTERKGYENLQAAIKRLPNPNPAQEVLDILVADYFPTIKPVIATAQTGADAMKLASGFEAPASYTHLTMPTTPYV